MLPMNITILRTTHPIESSSASLNQLAPVFAIEGAIVSASPVPCNISDNRIGIGADSDGVAESSAHTFRASIAKKRRLSFVQQRPIVQKARSTVFLPRIIDLRPLLKPITISRHKPPMENKPKKKERTARRAMTAKTAALPTNRFLLSGCEINPNQTLTLLFDDKHQGTVSLSTLNEYVFDANWATCRISNDKMSLVVKTKNNKTVTLTASNLRYFSDSEFARSANSQLLESSISNERLEALAALSLPGEEH